jgi:hypothetical protein
MFLGWKAGLVLRSEKPSYEVEVVNLGRRGRSSHTRPFHRYLFVGEGLDSFTVEGMRFVKYAREYLDARGGGSGSKSGFVFKFLRENKDNAFYTTQIAKSLADHGVQLDDVMANARRWEKKGLVYIRGYKTDGGQSPFREGYMLTWVDPKKQREQAMSEAVARTDKALEGVYASSPTMTRINRIRDMVVEHTQLRSLVGFTYLEDQLRCSHDQARTAVFKALKIYPNLVELKLFDAYRYYYHKSMGEEELHAAMEAKRATLRLEKGRDNRVGHNWEGACDWFIDHFTVGAKFWEQSHRGGKMDRRRITIHLLKGVGGRRQAAELDRVWEVNPSIFAEPITYVLSCKWGLVNKGHVDDFLEVLRWSNDFGVDTPSGREMKQGIIGVFAASAFNPKENVNVQGTYMSLAKYASLRRLQLVTAADFNEKLRGRGCPKMVTVQKACGLAKNEEEVRWAIDAIWKDPSASEVILSELRTRNQELYKFEEILEGRESDDKGVLKKDVEIVIETSG